jgi:putative heme-binding domain-containing protein
LPGEIWLTLERLPNESLAKRGKKLHANLFPTVAWEEVAAGYRKAWDGKADLDNGRLVFRKLCGSCHRIEDEGTHIGPPLASVIEKSNEQIALSVFQPNAEVDPRYQMYQLVTDDGVVHTGLMEASQGDVVVIRNAKGELERFQREEIEILKASGKSLMPEGLLSQMKPEEFRDVLAFIRQYAGRNQSPAKE